MKVLMPIPELDFDPTEVAVTWRSLKDRGIQVIFATPTGGESEGDHLMLTGEGLDPWGAIPLLRGMPLLGRFLRADAAARKAYGELEGDPSFQDPIKFADMHVEDYDGLVLPGGHRARGMQEYLESNALRKFVGAYFITGKPVGAICHGVLVVARGRSPLTGKSVLYGRKTTALPWAMERRAWNVTRFYGRFWDPNYFRTYVEKRGQPSGSKSVEYEVKAYLEKPTDFIDVEGTFMDRVRKSSNMFRDSGGNEMAAHVVVDGNYVSARWPGDAFTFAKKFGDLVILSAERHETMPMAAVLGEVQALADPKYDPFAQTQIVSRMPKAENPVADMNHTIIIKSPLLAEKAKLAEAAKAADETVVNAPTEKAESEVKPAADALATSAASSEITAAPATPVPAVVPAVVPPVAPAAVAEAVPALQAETVEAPADPFVKTHVLAEPPLAGQGHVEEFAKTHVLPESPLADQDPVDQFAKTQVLTASPLVDQMPVDDFAKTQVLAEPPLFAEAPDDQFAKTQVLNEPPIQSAGATEPAPAEAMSEPPIATAPVDDFAKTQVLDEPPAQSPTRSSSQTSTQSPTQTTASPKPEGPAHRISEPPSASAPADDFEKTQVLSRPPLKAARVTSAVDDFDRTMVVTRPSREELEKPEV